MPAEREASRARSVNSNSCNRRSNKPLMEKRRRARINQSLAELKNLIIDACVKKEQTSRSSKLEKADILEMTVRHVQSLQRQQQSPVPLVETGDQERTDDNKTSRKTTDHVKYQAGFKECTREVTLFMDSVDGFDCQLRRRLANHLLNRLSQLQKSTDVRTDRTINNNNNNKDETEAESSRESSDSGTNNKDELQVSSKVENSVMTSHPNSVVNGGLHLIPTRLLPTGEIAFIWPFNSNGQSDGESTRPVVASGSANWINGGKMVGYHDEEWSGQRNPALGHRLKEEAMWRPW